MMDTYRSSLLHGNPGGLDLAGFACGKIRPMAFPNGFSYTLKLFFGHACDFGLATFDVVIIASALKPAMTPMTAKLNV